MVGKPIEAVCQRPEPGLNVILHSQSPVPRGLQASPKDDERLWITASAGAAFHPPETKKAQPGGCAFVCAGRLDSER